MGYRNQLGSVACDTTYPGERVRLNYPSETNGGAREEREVKGVIEWDWARAGTTRVAARLATAIGTDAPGPLCDTIWQDQEQRDE